MFEDHAFVSPDSSIWEYRVSPDADKFVDRVRNRHRLCPVDESW